MSNPRFILQCLVVALLAASGSCLAAAEPAKATDDELRIRGIFESALPGTEARQSLRLIVHPHLGDLRQRDHLRTALGFRYGFSDRWEGTAETDLYLSHGLKSRAFLQDRGFSSVHLGTKYRLGDPWRIGWQSSIGADFTRPVGSPPPTVTDGLQHISPYLSFSRQLERHPGWRAFFGFGYDDVTTTSIRGRIEKNQLGGDAVLVSGGLLYERGTLTYTLETSYATMHPTRDITRDLFTVRPGLVWVVPPRYTFHSRGKWLLGLALRASNGPDGTDFGVSAKARVNFDFKRLLGLK